MRRLSGMAAFAALLASNPGAYAQTPAGVVVVPYAEGTVTQENGERFLDFISQNVDRVIGLRLVVEPAPEDGTFSVSAADEERRYLLLSVYRAEEGGTEVLINGEYRWEHGAWIVDGFFLVQPGGTHQGVNSFGLAPTDAAAVRLNPSVRLKTVQFR